MKTYLVEYKLCPLCKKSLPLSEFPLSVISDDGHGNTCKSCSKTTLERFHDEHPVRPTGSANKLFLVLDQSQQPVYVGMNWQLAFEHQPKDGSISLVTPMVLRRDFSDTPIVLSFLKGYMGGVWIQYF